MAKVLYFTTINSQPVELRGIQPADPFAAFGPIKSVKGSARCLRSVAPERCP